MSALKVIKNGKSISQSTRHINVRYFFIKEKVDERREVEVEVVYTKSAGMIADILTKWGRLCTTRPRCK